MSKIDFDNRIIIGKSGTIYKILPEKISVGRWPKYELWQNNITFRMDMPTFMAAIDDVILKLQKIKELGDAIKATIDLMELRNRVAGFLETGRSPLIEFASIFCLKTDNNGNVIEDVGDLTEDVIRDKFNDWKEIDQNDFFLLVSMSIPLFQKNYKLAQKRVNEETINT